MNRTGQPATPLNRLAATFRRREIAAFFRSHRYSIAVSGVVTLASLALFIAINFARSLRSEFVFLDNIEARSLDARFQYRGPVQPGPEIVVVAIDQKSYDRLGWPFARSHYARMLQNLKRDGARVVGFDAAFPKPDRSASGAARLAQLEEQYRAVHGAGAKQEFISRMHELREEGDSDAVFAKAIADSGNIVLGHLFFTDRSEIKDMDPAQIAAYDEIVAFEAYPQVLKRPSKQPYPFYLEAQDAIAVEPNLAIFAQAAASYGAFNFEADNDGTFRRASALFHYADATRESVEENFYPSLDIQMARLYLGVDPQQTILWFNPAGPEVVELGSKKLYPDVSGKLLINFSGPEQTYPRYSFIDVADGVTPPGTFRDKIVIVGATAIGIGDMRPIPFQKQSYPGVEIHANVLDNLLHDNFLRRGFAEEITDLWVLLFCGLVMGLLFVMGRPMIATLLYLAALAGFVGFVYYQFAVHGRWLSMVLPGATLTLNYLGVTSYRMLFEEKEKRKVRGAFNQYVSPGYITQILKDPGGLKLGGEEVELSVMFTDIRGFTSIAEKMTPTQLVQLLNQYLTEMTRIVFRTQGTLDKYIGDAVMAFWGRPYHGMEDHAARACLAALQMRQTLKDLNAEWTAVGKPALSIGIGINSGAMMVGNMGSEQRFTYTVMGDHVNLSSRIEGLNKEYGTQIILTEYTRQQIGEEFATRRLDLIRVKGKQQPVAIYELLGPASDRILHETLVREYERGLDAYQAGHWDEALVCFEHLAEQFPSDRPTQLFLDRCRQLAREAPEGVWDGVYTMTHK